MPKKHHEDRRDALRVIGAVGVTCAFPFSSDELYGQHAHQQHASAAPAVAATTYEPQVLQPEEWAVVNHLADLIIPATGTPGAIGAGVPEYIDRVLQKNPRSAELYRRGLRWLDGQARQQGAAAFLKLSPEAQIALLRPLSAAIDTRAPRTLGERFFRELKNMTADGYYTSKVGLLEELGYTGNTALASFPRGVVPEQ